MTDEASLIEPGTRYVHPYAKPLSLDRNSAALLGLETDRVVEGEFGLRAEEVPGRLVRRPVPLWAFCHIVRAPSRPLELVELGPVPALMAMLPSFMCFSPSRDPLRELSDMVTSHPVWQVRGGTPHSAATAVLDLAEAPRRIASVEATRRLRRIGAVDDRRDGRPLSVWPTTTGPWYSTERPANTSRCRSVPSAFSMPSTGTRR
jgi:hypothetical protein